MTVCGVPYKFSSEQVKLVLLFSADHNFSITANMLSAIIEELSVVAGYVDMCRRLSSRSTNGETGE